MQENELKKINVYNSFTFYYEILFNVKDFDYWDI